MVETKSKLGKNFKFIDTSKKTEKGYSFKIKGERYFLNEQTLKLFVIGYQSQICKECGNPTIFPYELCKSCYFKKKEREKGEIRK